MNRQQAPQPVVRPIQIGDRYELLDTPPQPIIKGRWYLVADSIVEGYENQVFPVRVNPVTNELEFPLINDNVLFYSANRDGTECVITNINEDAESLIDYSELTNVGSILGADGTSQTEDNPSDVLGYFEL